MNLTKTRAVLTALRDDFQKQHDATPHNKEFWAIRIEVFSAVTDLLDTEKWPEHAKVLTETVIPSCETAESDAFDQALEAGAVALALVPQLEARVNVLTEALETIRDGFDCDIDAHKYGTHCRCCTAHRALTGAKENEHA